MNKKPHTFPTCKGEREVNGKQCPTCRGAGVVWERAEKNADPQPGDELRK